MKRDWLKCTMFRKTKYAGIGLDAASVVQFSFSYATRQLGSELVAVCELCASQAQGCQDRTTVP